MNSFDKSNEDHNAIRKLWRDLHVTNLIDNIGSVVLRVVQCVECDELV